MNDFTEYPNFAGVANALREKVKTQLSQPYIPKPIDDDKAFTCPYCGEKVMTYYRCKHHKGACFECVVHTDDIGLSGKRFRVQCKEYGQPVECTMKKVSL